MKASYTSAREYLRAQHIRQKRTHDNYGISEEFQIGDRVWLYTPAIPKGQTKKFASLWKGPYTILDKPGPVTYKVQLIGVAGYTSTTNPSASPAPAHSDTRPSRAQRPPARYDDFVRH